MEHLDSNPGRSVEKLCCAFLPIDVFKFLQFISSGERNRGRDPDTPDAAAGRKGPGLQLRPLLGELHRPAVVHHGLSGPHRRLRSEAQARGRFERRLCRQEDRQEGEAGGPDERPPRDAEGLDDAALPQLLHPEAGS